MFIGHSGVAIGYSIVVCLLCWFVILSRGRVIAKCMAIAFSVFYAVALYMYLPQMEGYPSANEIPEGSILISIKVQEPNGNGPGAFFLWCNPDPNYKEKAMSLFSPGGLLSYTGRDKPRAYTMPYDRELHKKLLEQQKKAKKTGGFLIVTRKKGDKKGNAHHGDGREVQEKTSFRVINPVEILTKGD